MLSKSRVATVREKVLENEKISRSGKSQGITFSVRQSATVREKVLENEKISRSGKSQGITFSVRDIKKK